MEKFEIRKSALNPYKIDRLIKENKVEAFRLIYVSASENKSSVTVALSGPIMIPRNVDFEKVCRTISYLYDVVESDEGNDKTEIHATNRVAEMLEDCGYKTQLAQQYGYSSNKYLALSTKPFHSGKVYEILKPVDKVVDIIAFDNKQSLGIHGLNNRYFDWYFENVTDKEFSRIVSKLNYDIPEEGMEQ